MSEDERKFPDEVYRRVGQRARWVRMLIEPDQAEAAKILGVTQSTLSRLEGGRRAFTFENLLTFSNKFRVSMDYVAKGDLSPTASFDEELRRKLLRRYYPVEALQTLPEPEPDTTRNPQPGTVLDGGKPRPPRRQSPKSSTHA